MRQLGIPQILEIKTKPIDIEQILPNSKIKKKLIKTYYDLLSKYYKEYLNRKIQFNGELGC